MDSGVYIGPDGAADRYKLVRSIGRGGEAVLYLAELELGGAGEPVVVKMLDAGPGLSPELFGRVSAKWREQAELLRFVHRPGVVGIREHFEGPSPHPEGRLPEGGGRALYLVMNHVRGLDLRDWRAERTLESAAERREAVRCLEQLAEVLDWLHSGAATPSGRRVVHGDLSPGNVMVDEQGQATLVDFGLSKLAADHQTAEVWFTPGFAAPEVFEGTRSPATDRYAFGAIAYFLLSGESPATLPDSLRAALLALPQLAGPDEERAARLAAIVAADPRARPVSLTGWVRELRAHVVSASRPAPAAGPPRKAPAATAPLVPPPPASAPSAAPVPPPQGAPSPPVSPVPALGVQAGRGPVPPGPAGPAALAPSQAVAAAAPPPPGHAPQPVYRSPVPPSVAAAPPAGRRGGRTTRVVLAAVVAAALVGGGVVAGMKLAGGKDGAPQAKDSPGTHTSSARPPATTGTGTDTGTSAGSGDGGAAASGGDDAPTENALLADLTPTDKSLFTLERGTAAVNGTTYRDALRTDGGCYSLTEGQEDFAEYNLGKSYTKLDVVVGIDDNSPNAGMTFTLVGDGRRLLHDRVTVGHPLQRDLDVSGVLRLRVEWEPDDQGNCPVGVLGDPTLVP